MQIIKLSIIDDPTFPIFYFTDKKATKNFISEVNKLLKGKKHLLQNPIKWKTEVLNIFSNVDVENIFTTLQNYTESIELYRKIQLN